jgi:hypothetical protein
MLTSHAHSFFLRAAHAHCDSKPHRVAPRCPLPVPCVPRHQHARRLHGVRCMRSDSDDSAPPPERAILATGVAAMDGPLPDVLNASFPGGYATMSAVRRVIRDGCITVDGVVGACGGWPMICAAALHCCGPPLEPPANRADGKLAGCCMAADVLQAPRCRRGRPWSAWRRWASEPRDACRSARCSCRCAGSGGAWGPGSCASEAMTVLLQLGGGAYTHPATPVQPLCPSHRPTASVPLTPAHSCCLPPASCSWCTRMTTWRW